MSSLAAMLNSHPAPYTLTENDWNDFAENMCEEKGTETPGPIIYLASKTAAEKAFWKFRDEKKPSFSMSAINPSYAASPFPYPFALPFH
jgi:nucleoside-diphosphate-sugar epimerase